MTPYYADDFVTLYHGDCRSVPLSGTVVITDPPFNVGKDYGVTDDNLHGDAYDALMRYVEGLASRHAWITPTNRLALYAAILGRDAQPVVVRRGAKGPKRWGWFDQFDMVLVRGKPHSYASNLWDDIRLKGEGYFFREETYGHPGYTPYPLMRRLIGLLAAPGDVVVEPFVGTGTCLVAAKQLGVTAVGTEINEAYCEIAARRLAQDVFDFGAAS